MLVVAHATGGHASGPHNPTARHRVHQGLLAWDGGWYESIAGHGYATAGAAVGPFLPGVPDGRPGRSAGYRGSASGTALIVLANLCALAAMAGLVVLVRHDLGDARWPGARCGCWPGPVGLFVGPGLRRRPVAGCRGDLPGRPHRAVVVGGGRRAGGRRWSARSGSCWSSPWPSRWAGAPSTPERRTTGRPRRPVGPCPPARDPAGSVAPRWSAPAASSAGSARQFGDPWLPLRVQQQNGHRGGLTLPLGPMVHDLDVGGSTATTWGAPSTSRGWCCAWSCVVVAFRRLPLSYGAFAVAVLVVSLTSTNLDSFERYALGGFPLVVAASTLTARRRGGGRAGGWPAGMASWPCPRWSLALLGVRRPLSACRVGAFPPSRTGTHYPARAVGEAEPRGPVPAGRRVAGASDAPAGPYTAASRHGPDDGDTAAPGAPSRIERTRRSTNPNGPPDPAGSAAGRVGTGRRPPVVVIGGGRPGSPPPTSWPRRAIRWWWSRRTRWSAGSAARSSGTDGASTSAATGSSPRSKPVEEFWHEVLPPEDFLLRPRMSRIFYEGKFYDYPIKLGNALSNLGLVEALRCGLSFLWVRIHPPKDLDTLEGYIVSNYGWRLYHHFFKTYNEKVWGVPASEISADWGAQRIKGMSLWNAVWEPIRTSVAGKRATSPSRSPA